MQPFGRNGYGPKIGGLCPFGGGGAGSPSNTMWPGPMPTCMPSFILIRQTVWLQYINVTDRQTGQTDRQTDRQTDNGPIVLVAQQMVLQQPLRYRFVYAQRTHVIRRLCRHCASLSSIKYVTLCLPFALFLVRAAIIGSGTGEAIQVRRSTAKYCFCVIS